MYKRQEQEAFHEAMANIGSGLGTSISFARSAGQQVAMDCLLYTSFRKVRKLVIITIECKTFLDLLFDVTVYHRILLPATRC